jgi:hypothetical protein
MGGHPVGEPNQQPMPPCHRCGAAFAAHLDGRCPQTGPTTENLTAPQWAGIPPYAYWAAPPGGPPPAPALAAPEPPWRDWPRRHPLLAGAIMVVVLLATGGIVLAVSQAGSQTTATQATASQATSGDATACSAYWNMTDTDPYEVWGEVAGWQDLEAAAPGITNPALSRAVQGFDEDLNNNDLFDSGPASVEIGAVCTELGYGNPG